MPPTLSLLTAATPSPGETFWTCIQFGAEIPEQNKRAIVPDGKAIERTADREVPSARRVTKLLNCSLPTADVRVQRSAFNVVISNIARADEANNTLEVLNQFAFMRSHELVEKRALLRLQAGLPEKFEPDRNSSVAEPSAALEEAHMAFTFRRRVHHHDLLIVAPQRGEIGTD